MSKLISIVEASDLLGVDNSTLRRWDKEGKLIPIRTLGGHRRYKIDDIEVLLGNLVHPMNKNKNVFIYCRVSNKKQQQSGNLSRQRERLVKYCNEKQYNVIHIYEEVASGINDNRRELIKMLRELAEVDSIVIEYTDRLAGFGFNYLKEFTRSCNVEIETVAQKDKLEPNEEMVKDLISVLTCFSARLYGSRGGKKLKKDIEKSLQQLEEERCVNRENNDTSCLS